GVVPRLPPRALVDQDNRTETLRTDRPAVPFSLMFVISMRRRQTGWDMHVPVGMTEASRREERYARCFYSGGSNEQQPGKKIAAERIRRPEYSASAGCRSAGPLSAAGLPPLATRDQYPGGVHPDPARARR